MAKEGENQTIKMAQDNSQLELFSQEGRVAGAKNSALNKSFINHIWNYEKTILTIIGLVLTSIISFSLGVEKGKRIANSNNNLRLDFASNTPAPQTKPLLMQRVAPEVEETVKVETMAKTEKSEDYIKGFTIQLASYKTKNYAQIEAQALKKKGLAPLVLTKGSYSVLCVGNFTNKQTAQTLLSELKTRYQGCYLRRL